MQVVVDATSLELFKACPRKYYLSMVRGFESVFGSYHLTFGIFLHEALQQYDIRRSEGMTHEDAFETTIHELLIGTWGWESGDPKGVKTRDTLVRSVAWFLDRYEDDPYETYLLQDGRPATELSFKLPTGIFTSLGEEIVLSGHLDKVVHAAGQLWVKDYKTTSSDPGNIFIEGFNPHNQMTLYTAAGQVVLSEPIAGVIIDGIQVGVGFTRFNRGFSMRTKGQINEFWSELGWWISLLEECAYTREWPMNETACGNYGGCKFRAVCAADPSLRENYLKDQSKFKVRIWDPTENR